MDRTVCIICNSYPPEIGAAPTRMYHLARLLRQNGYRVEVICGLPNYPLGKIFPTYRGRALHREELEGIVVKRVWLYPSNSRQPLHRLFSMLSHSVSLWAMALPALLRRKPDLFIVSSPPLFMALTGAMLGRLCGRKVLLNISDLYPSTALDLGLLKKGWLYRRLEYLEKRLYRQAHAVMGQSTAILEHVQEQLNKAIPTFLYRNLLPAVKGSSVETGTGTRRRKIVYAGLLGPVQGIRELCHSIDFAALHLELHLYGDGPDKEAIKTLTEENPDSGVYLHPVMAHEEMTEVLKNYDAALVPLKTDIRGAVPSKMYAALAAGIPVFFSGNGEGAAFISDHDLGWVSAPGDYRALHDRLLLFSGMDAVAYAALRDRCTAIAQGLLNKDRQDDAFLHFIRSLF